jgi:NAD(P)H dehydrogenase (quinone)
MKASDIPIAVIGAAGSSGLHLLRALKAAGRPARAIVHGPAGADRAAAAGATEHRQAEMSDIASLCAALEGTGGIYMIPPSLHPDETTFAVNALRAAERVGAHRFVYASVMHPHTPSMPHHMRKAAAEAEIRKSALPWAILQPAMYAQVACQMFGGGPPGAVRVPFNASSIFSVVDLRDLAEIAVKVLTDPLHTFASYELCGPSLSMAEMVRQAASIRGVSLVPESIAPQDAPLPPRYPPGSSSASDLRAMFAEYDRHGLRGNSTVLHALLGREPGNFEQVARQIFKPQ